MVMPCLLACRTVVVVMDSSSDHSTGAGTHQFVGFVSYSLPKAVVVVDSCSDHYCRDQFYNHYLLPEAYFQEFFHEHSKNFPRTFQEHTTDIPLLPVNQFLSHQVNIPYKHLQEH